MGDLPTRIEAAEGPSRELDAEIAVATHIGISAVPRYFTSSLDAALTLYIHIPDMISTNPRKVCADALRQRNEILGKGRDGRA